jgi:8-oxo-dGTP diphosphatase
MVGIVTNARGEILITRRPDHAHQGGLWEFPGGKLESGEAARAGLIRELREELGIGVRAAQPLTTVRHVYPDKAVLLDVWQVQDYTGDPCGLEGQPLRWVAPRNLHARDFPAADAPIIEALGRQSTAI